jgi:cytoskeletal protein RodZ
MTVAESDELSRHVESCLECDELLARLSTASPVAGGSAPSHNATRRAATASSPAQKEHVMYHENHHRSQSSGTKLFVMIAVLMVIPLLFAILLIAAVFWSRSSLVVQDMPATAESAYSYPIEDQPLEAPALAETAPDELTPPSPSRRTPPLPPEAIEGEPEAAPAIVTSPQHDSAVLVQILAELKEQNRLHREDQRMMQEMFNASQRRIKPPADPKPEPPNEIPDPADVDAGDVDAP